MLPPLAAELPANDGDNVVPAAHRLRRCAPVATLSQFGDVGRLRAHCAPWRRHGVTRPSRCKTRQRQRGSEQ